MVLVIIIENGDMRGIHGPGREGPYHRAADLALTKGYAFTSLVALDRFA